jgi:hypothetical protein
MQGQVRYAAVSVDLLPSILLAPCGDLLYNSAIPTWSHSP